MWETVKLGDVCTITNGSTPLRKEKRYWEEGNVPWFTIDDFRVQGKNITYTQQNVTQAAVADKKVRLVPENSVLLCCTASIGEAAIARVELATNQQFNALTPKSSALNSDYLYFVATTLTKTLLSVSGSTTINFISMGKLKEIRIPLPPLAEQQRIVAKLDAAFAEIDTAVEAADVQVGNIDMLRQRILNGWIENNANSQDYYTVQDCIDNKWIKPPFDGNHGEIHPKASDYKAAGIPFIMARDLSNGDVNIIDCKFIAPEKASSLRVGFAENDDVLFTHKGTIGEVALLKCEVDFVMLTPQVTAYRVIDETRVDRIYLYFLFKSAFFQSQIQQIAGIGTTRAYIGITRQKQLNLCLPPIHLQQEAVRILTSSEPHVSTISSANIQKLEQFSKLKSAILAQELQSEAA
jgi:type I restriction enzyme, S subunit